MNWNFSNGRFVENRESSQTLFQRMEMLDVVRLIAAFGVIILHAAALDEATTNIIRFGRFAVPFFTMVAVALTVDGLRRAPAKPMGAFCRSRLMRIYVPFLFWTFAYLVFRNFKYFFITHQPLIRFDWPLLLAGSAHHLWFLPFILLATLSAAIVAKFVLFRLPASVVVPISLGAGVIVLLIPHPVVPITSGGDGDGLSIQYFVGLVWQALPLAFAGVAVGCVWQELCSLSYRASLAWIGLVVLVVSLVLGPVFSDSLALQDISGIGAVFLALGPWKNRLIRILAGWGKAAYGIYLVHVFWYLSLDMIFHKLHLFVGIGGVCVIIVLTTVFSILSAVLLSKSRFTAWTIGLATPTRGLNS